MCNNKCNKCHNIVLVTDVKEYDNYLQLITRGSNLCNDDRICFIIPSNFDIPKTPKPVVLSIGEELFGWLSKTGNFVYTDQVRNRRLYVGRIKSDTRIILNERSNLCRTSADLPVIPTSYAFKPLNITDKIVKGSDKK